MNFLRSFFFHQFVDCICISTLSAPHRFGFGIGFWPLVFRSAARWKSFIFEKYLNLLLKLLFVVGGVVVIVNYDPNL